MNKRQAARDGDENSDPSNRRLLRPDGPLGPIAKLAGDLDWLAGQHEFRSLEPHLVLRRSDLGFDDLNGEILLVTAGEPGGARPDGFGALAEARCSAGGYERPSFSGFNRP